MDANQYLKTLIGELHFQVAVLQSQVESLKIRLQEQAKNEDQSDRPESN
jgi:hypothetical protein